jgi:RNA polymerase sigma factor (TIGR02999 family)
MSHGEVTALLKRWGSGDAAALDALMPLVYRELHELARRQLRSERPDHTLGATALVNEAFLKLVGQDRVDWQERAQFIGLAAQAMRRILVDHARRRQADKRPDPRLQLELDAAEQLPARELDLVALDDALNDLARLDPRQARVVELKFFGGLDLEEVGEVIGISAATVSREWTMARAWLKRELTR